MIVVVVVVMMITTTTTIIIIVSANASNGQRMNSEGKCRTRGLHRPQKRQATNKT